MTETGCETKVGDFAPVWWRRAEVAVCSLLINLLALALPLALLQVYDRILPNRSDSTALLLFSGVVLAIAGEGSLRLLRAVLMGRAGAEFEYRASSSAFKHLLSADLAAFESVGAGVHLDRFAALGTLRDFYSGQAIMTLYDLPFTVIYFILIFYLGGELVAVPLTLLAVFVLATAGLGTSLRRWLDRQAEAEDERFNFMISVLRGIHTVKTMAMEGLLMRRYERLQERRAEVSQRVDLRSQVMFETGFVMSQVCVMAVAGLGSLLVLDGRLSVGGLSACSLLAGRALQPVQSAIGFWSRFQSIRLAREQLEDVFRMPRDAFAATAGLVTGLETIHGALALRGVRFRYGDDQPDVLRCIDCEIASGEMVAIVGANGSGRSTLMAILRGLMSPTEGDVLLDGRPLTAYDPGFLKSQVAYLPQRELLFRGTILENLTLFRPEMEARAIEAADFLGVADAILTLPLGFHTLVGDGVHEAMPRGLVQRLAIARALVNQPKVLLFDEANTGIDIAGDEGVKQALGRLKGHCTVLLVSHRPSFLKLADRVYTLQAGTLTEGHAPGSNGPRPSQPRPNRRGGAP